MEHLSENTGERQVERWKKKLSELREWLEEQFKIMGFVPRDWEWKFIEDIALGVQVDIDCIDKEGLVIQGAVGEKLKTIPKDLVSDRRDVLKEAIKKSIKLDINKPVFQSEVLYRFILKQFGVDPRVLSDMQMPKEKWGWYFRKIEGEQA